MVLTARTPMLAAITAQAAAMTHCAFPRGLSVFSLILRNIPTWRWRTSAALSSRRCMPPPPRPQRASEVDGARPRRRRSRPRRARPAGRTRRRRPWCPTRCAASRASTPRRPRRRPARPPRSTTRPALDLMRAASRPQRCGRGRETPTAAEARGRRDAAIVALAFCAGLRRSEIAVLAGPAGKCWRVMWGLNDLADPSAG